MVAQGNALGKRVTARVQPCKGAITFGPAKVYGALAGLRGLTPPGPQGVALGYSIPALRAALSLDDVPQREMT